MLLSYRREMDLQSSGTLSQTGSDEPEVRPRTVLRGETGDYELRCFRFNGCFSNVAECKEVSTGDAVVIKIFKKRAPGSLQPNKELAMLKRIRGLDQENIVRFLGDFQHIGHTCLTFEMLDKNLHELLKERIGNRLPLLQIRPIAKQLLSALQSLKTAGIIHTSIKPNNIMVTREKPLRVKLIDFGSAVAAAEVQRGVIMQPIAYRSPDVILGLPVSEAVDVWSLGAVLATMYLGSLPFPQRCQYHQVKTMVETLGQPEGKLLSDGAYTHLYFSRNQDSTAPSWRLNTAAQYKAASGFVAQKHRGSSPRFHYLDDLVELNPENSFGCKTRFVGLLRQMLRLNPEERTTPSAALRHPFVTLIESGAEEAVASAAADSGTPGVREGRAVGCNDSSAGGACSDEAAVMSAVKDLAAGSEASEGAAGRSADEAPSGYSIARSIDAGPGEGVPAPAVGDSDATACSSDNDDDNEAAVTPACAEADIGTDGVSAARGARGVMGFLGRVFRTLRCCCCCTANPQE